MLLLQDDVRRYIALSTFGFFEGGTLDVNLYNFRVEDGREGETVSSKIIHFDNHNLITMNLNVFYFTF